MTSFIRRTLWVLLVFSTVIWACQPARAQTPSAMAEWQYSAGVPLRSMFENPMPDWEFQIGPAADLRPLYLGAGKYRVELGPDIDVRYKDEFFFSTGEGLGVNIFKDKNYRIGASLGVDLGRQADSATRLHGTGDIGYAPVPKLFAEYVIFPVVLRADVRRALGGVDGFAGDLSAYLPVCCNDRFFIFVGPSLAFVDDTYNRHEFGISATQHLRSGLPRYNAAGGLQSGGIGASLTWILSDHWLVEGDVSAERLLGDAAHSPLTQARFQYDANVSIGYRF